MPTRAIWIDADGRKASEVELPGEPGVRHAPEQASAVQRLIGGYMDLVERFENGDVLFVNEARRLMRGPVPAFRLAYAKQNYTGNAVIVGEDCQGGIRSASSTLDEVRAALRWPTVRGGD